MPSNAKDPKDLKVQHTSLANGGLPCWGITDGKGMWFFYGYPSQGRAENMLRFFQIPGNALMTVSHPAPVSLAG